MRRGLLTATAFALAVSLAGCSGQEGAPAPTTAAASSSAPAPSSTPVSSPSSSPEESGSPATTAPSSSGSTPPPVTTPAPEPTTAARDLDSADSPTVVVNKARPLDPVDHAPAALEPVDGVQLRPEAAEAFEVLRADAAAAGHRLTVLSGYRSYERQQQVYDGWVRVHGQKGADRLSARPGHSEHQTGLAVDIGDAATPACDLGTCFGATPAGRWVADHAHEHGFVVRYPAGSEAVTGFAAEPWHLRWLGPEAAAEVRAAGGVVETAFGLPSAPDYLG